MKDGRTHLAYKAEHVIDLESEVVVAATIYAADQSDGETLLQSVSQSQENVARAGSDAFAAEVVADKGYHKAQTLAECTAYDLRTYVPQRTERRPRHWTDKPAAWRDALRANRRRVRGERSRRLQRLRSERVERSFAHVCNTGRARRTWLRTLDSAVEPLRVHRHKRLTHADLAGALDLQSEVTPGITRRDVQHALDLVTKIMNRVERHFINSETAYELVI
jgi:Transposase DDE domain